jgi:hypothetical protein
MRKRCVYEETLVSKLEDKRANKERVAAITALAEGLYATSKSLEAVRGVPRCMVPGMPQPTPQQKHTIETCPPSAPHPPPVTTHYCTYKKRHKIISTPRGG